MVRILVTGFGAFPGAPRNPTQALVHRLDTIHRRALARAGIDVRCSVLPVDYDEVGATIEALLQRHRPDIVVHLGLAARRRTISIETRARNRLSVVHPDAVRRLAGRMHVQTGGEPVRAARWSAARLVHAATRAGYRTQISIDAGDYLCNQALYTSLGLHEGSCGFIHVPKLRGRRRIESDHWSGNSPGKQLPTLVDLERSIIAAIRLLAADHRRTASR